MRVQQAQDSNDPDLATNLQEFADYLLDVGNGNIPTVLYSQFIRVKLVNSKL